MRRIIGKMKSRDGKTGMLKRLSRLRNLRIRKEQILCMVLAVLSAVLYMLFSENPVEGGSISRGGYGSRDKEYELIVRGLEDDSEKLNVKISGRRYAGQAVEEVFDRIAEKLPLMILNGNESLGAVTHDLSFPGEDRENRGVTLTWTPEDPGLIGYDGEIRNSRLQEPVKTHLSVTMKAGGYSREQILTLEIRPPKKTERQDRRERLEEMIRSADLKDPGAEAVRLPEELDGRKLQYTIPPDPAPAVMILTGLICALLLGLKPLQERKTEAKKRNDELAADYSELVSKIIVFTEAGLTAGNAFRVIRDGYKKELEKGGKKRAVYEEVCTTVSEMERGVPEGSAFRRFAARCGQRCYLRLCSILEQGRRSGDRMMKATLELEMHDAFEQRKNVAKRLGEEAGTRLLLPLMISLAAVLMIIMVPAVMTIH